MKRCAGLLAALVMAWSAGAAFAQVEAVVLYDDFADSRIASDKWFEGERDRRVVGKGLQLLQADWGGTNSNLGRIVTGWGEAFARPVRVTRVQAIVRVNESTITSCAANSSKSRVRARIAGTFFNTGNRVLGDYSGDVIAQIMLFREDPATTYTVIGRVDMCRDSGCTDAVALGTPVNLGTANEGQDVVLDMEWDPANNRFVFQRDSGASVGQVSYTQFDGNEPGRPFLELATRTEVANCLPQSGPRALARIGARFDNVLVNNRAVP